MALLLPPNLTFSETAWGPQSEATPLFEGIPYAPFNKTERVGRAADWMNTNRTHTTRPGSVSTAFNDFEEEEEDFALVDNRLYKSGVQRRTFVRTQKFNKPSTRVKGGTNYQLQGKRPTKLQQRTLNPAKRKNQKRGGGGGPSQSSFSKNKRRTEPTVEIQSSWGETVALGEYKSIELNVLRQAYATPPEVETLSVHGKLEEFNSEYSDLRRHVPLDRHWAIERVFHNVTTSDDPILGQLLNSGAGNVFATDAIIAVLMASVVSVYSWDLKVKVIDKGEDKILIFDKRDGSYFDYLDVNENSNETPLDEDEVVANTVENLSKEALGLNCNFSQQILFKNEAQTLKFSKPNPFLSGEEKPASTAYLYRSFALEDDIKIVARTEVNSYKSVKGAKPEFLFVRALNEYDPKITGGWRKILEHQKGGAFATELKNNNCKITKWVAQAHLAGASNIKLGYVARVNPRDNYSHTILDVTDFTVDELAQELGTNYEKLWGVVKHIIDVLRLLDAGEYCLLRDPTKKSLVAYRTDQ